MIRWWGKRRKERKERREYSVRRGKGENINRM